MDEGRFSILQHHAVSFETKVDGTVVSLLVCNVSYIASDKFLFLCRLLTLPSLVSCCCCPSSDG